MRKNPYFREIQNYVFKNIVLWGEKKGIKLPRGKLKAKVNYIFKNYKDNFRVDMFRITLRHLRDKYNFGVGLH